MTVSLLDRIVGKPSTKLVIVTLVAGGVLLFFGYLNSSTFSYVLGGAAIIAAIINIVRLKGENAGKDD